MIFTVVYAQRLELGFDGTYTFNLNLEFATAFWSFLFSGFNMTFDHYLCSKLPKRFPYLSTRAFLMVELNLEPKMKSVYLMNGSQNCYKSLLNVFMPRKSLELGIQTACCCYSWPNIKVYFLLACGAYSHAQGCQNISKNVVFQGFSIPVSQT